MRLVCPNCSAQYEVDASLLPAEGTEVQCSACSTVWFQPGPDAAAPTPRPAAERARRPAPDQGRPAATRAEPAAPDAARTSAPEKPLASAAPRPTTDPAPDLASPPQPAPEAPPVPHPKPEAVTDTGPFPEPRALDPAVADVLRQEAEFEARQRAREGAGLETQEELGLFGPVASGHDTPATRSAASSLPDIDDISSTLEPIDTERAGQTELPQTHAARRRSFLAGLLVPLVVAGLLALMYLMAPILASAVPALDTPLSGYVGLVEQARAGLAGLLGLSL